MQVSAHFFIRRDGELLQFVELRRPRLACRRNRTGAAGTTATTIRSASSSKAWRASAFEPAQYEALAGLCARSRSTTRSQHIAGHEHIAPGRKRDPGRASTGRCCAGAAAGPAECFPAVRVAARRRHPVAKPCPCGLARDARPRHGAPRANLLCGAPLPGWPRLHVPSYVALEHTTCSACQSPKHQI